MVASSNQLIWFITGASRGFHVTVDEPGAFRTDFLDASSLVRTTNSIDDYAATSGTTRQWANQSNHAQEGDPIKLASAIVEIATTPEPPLRIQFGADCIARVEEKLAKVADEMKRWRKLSLSTGFKSAA